MPAQYAIGIDLGTTNSVLAYARLGEDPAAAPALPIPQLVAAGTVEERNILPSFLYLATDAGARQRGVDLPWKRGGAITSWGISPRSKRRTSPRRTVAGAKSLARHTRVDRHAPILPLNAPADVAKVSPVEAARATSSTSSPPGTRAHPEAPIDDQQVVLTVPASFDAAARELTREAALAAGLPAESILLEEPQAALYAWLADKGDQWRQQLKVGDTLLVCDVGGGTTDFTLIGVTEEDGELALRRIAVGSHTLVGGDNMDLALAHCATTAFAAKGVNLNPWQSVSLWHACRTAKETLLAEKGPKKHPVAVLGRGSKVIGGTVKIDLTSDAVRELLLDGFFPAVRSTDARSAAAPAASAKSACPTRSDTAITRHLARFLASSAGSLRTAQACPPDPHPLQRRRLQGRRLPRAAPRRHCSWFKKAGDPPRAPANHDLDFAVARGAAYYGAAKRGRGVRIRGGRPAPTTSASKPPASAVPGAPPPSRPCASSHSAWRKAPRSTSPAQRDRPGRRRAGHLPLLRLRHPQTRQARRPPRPTPGRELKKPTAWKPTSPSSKDRRRLRPRQIPIQDHRAGRLRTLVRKPKRPTMETRIQRPGGLRRSGPAPRTPVVRTGGRLAYNLA